MTVRERQSLFVRLVADLIRYGTSLGFEFTFGDAYRSPEQAAANADAGTGIRHSLHIDRLAIDLNLFRGGDYLTDTAAYEPLGKYWKGLHPDARWGGDFRAPAKKDGNHFSLSCGDGRA
jgi:hypothetical protein